MTLNFISVPDVPVNFDVTEQYDTLSNTTITFSWDPPQGYGVKTVVDYYLLSITPTSLYPPPSTVVNGTSVNVTVQYNLDYTATLSAVNCAGEGSYIILATKFSKYNN